MPDRTDTWFAVESIGPETFALSEYGHWENAHSYLLFGTERALLIDTGLGIGDIHAVVTDLTTRSVTVATTHVHWDHIGGHSAFDTILVHEVETEWLRDGIPGLSNEEVRADLTRDVSRPLPTEFDPTAYTMYTGSPTDVLHDGTRIDLGDREVYTLHTPGHSPGHLCFHEPARGYLWTGDLLYGGTINAFFPSTNPTALAASLRRIATIDDVQTILPGHHEIPLDGTLRRQAREAIETLSDDGHIHHGSGIHEFEEFSFRF